MIGTHGRLVLGLLALAGLVASHSAAAIPSEANPAYDPQADRPRGGVGSGCPTND